MGFSGAQASTAKQKVMGISPRALISGEVGDAVVCGTAIVAAGGAFSMGASLVVDARGRAVAASGTLNIAADAIAVQSSAASGSGVLAGADLPEFVFADALEAASSAEQFVEVLLRR